MNFLRKQKRNKQDTAGLFVKQQAERIEELRKENAELNKQLSLFREKESEIAETFRFAQKKRDEYLSELKVRYALENERLKRFCEKLESYHSREELLRAYDDSFSALKNTRRELERILKEELGQGADDYLSERNRLGDERELPFFPENNIVHSDLSKSESISEEELQELLEQL